MISTFTVAETNPIQVFPAGRQETATIENNGNARVFIADTNAGQIAAAHEILPGGSIQWNARTPLYAFVEAGNRTTILVNDSTVQLGNTRVTAAIPDTISTEITNTVNTEVVNTVNTEVTNVVTTEVANIVNVAGDVTATVTGEVDATITGPVTVTGAVDATVTGDVNATITGPVAVTGSVDATLTGPISATITGPVDADITGPVTVNGAVTSYNQYELLGDLTAIGPRYDTRRYASVILILLTVPTIGAPALLDVEIEWLTNPLHGFGQGWRVGDRVIFDGFVSRGQGIVILDVKGPYMTFSGSLNGGVLRVYGSTQKLKPTYIASCSDGALNGGIARATLPVINPGGGMASVNISTVSGNASLFFRNLGPESGAQAWLQPRWRPIDIAFAFWVSLQGASTSGWKDDLLLPPQPVVLVYYAPGLHVHVPVTATYSM